MIAERFRFHKRDQQIDESVKDFNVALRKLSKHCNFGTNLNDALRDRFVCGLPNEAIQKKLLSVANLTYEKALETALAMESASKDVVELQAKQVQPVNKLKVKHHKKKKEKSKPKQSQPQETPPAKEKVACFHCARTNHEPNKCKFKTATCYKCKKIGHIVPACKPQFKKQQIHNLETGYSDSSETDSEEYLYSLTDSNKGNRDAIYITPSINGKEIPMELDTGADVSVTSQKDYEKYFSDLNISDTN